MAKPLAICFLSLIFISFYVSRADALCYRVVRCYQQYPDLNRALRSEMEKGYLDTDEEGLKRICREWATLQSCVKNKAYFCSRTDKAKYLGLHDSFQYMCNEGFEDYLAHHACFLHPNVEDKLYLCQRNYNSQISRLLYYRWSYTRSRLYALYCNYTFELLDCGDAKVAEECGETAARINRDMVDAMLRYTLQLYSCFDKSKNNTTAARSTTSSWPRPTKSTPKYWAWLTTSSSRHWEWLTTTSKYWYWRTTTTPRQRTTTTPRYWGRPTTSGRYWRRPTSRPTSPRLLPRYISDKRRYVSIDVVAGVVCGLGGLLIIASLVSCWFCYQRRRKRARAAERPVAYQCDNTLGHDGINQSAYPAYDNPVALIPAALPPAWSAPPSYSEKDPVYQENPSGIAPDVQSPTKDFSNRIDENSTSKGISNPVYGNPGMCIGATPPSPPPSYRYKEPLEKDFPRESA